MDAVRPSSTPPNKADTVAPPAPPLCDEKPKTAEPGAPKAAMTWQERFDFVMSFPPGSGPTEEDYARAGLYPFASTEGRDLAKEYRPVAEQSASFSPPKSRPVLKPDQGPLNLPRGARIEPRCALDLPAIAKITKSGGMAAREMGRKALPPMVFGEPLMKKQRLETDYSGGKEKKVESEETEQVPTKRESARADKSVGEE